MKYRITIILSIIFRLLSYSQETIDSLIIYNKNKTYIYKAVFIDEKGDTLTKESITLKPTGEKWFRVQEKIKFIYTPNIQRLESFIIPVNSRQKKREKWTKKKAKKNKIHIPWPTSTNTGAVENDSVVWIHPFRANQYVYTEIAPFPEVQFSYLYKGGEWESTLYITAGWDNFKGTVKSEYKVKGIGSYQNDEMKLDSCWVIESIGNHSELGTSYQNFLFHQKYGFVEMKYKFYNGVRIEFFLIETIDLRKE